MLHLDIPTAADLRDLAARRRSRVVPGAVTFADSASADSHGVIDEIAGRVLLPGGTVIGACADDRPGDTGLAAILRYAV